MFYVKFTCHQTKFKWEKFKKLIIKMQNQLQKINKLEIIRNDLQKSFIGFTLENEKLLKSSEQLKQ